MLRSLVRLISIVIRRYKLLTLFAIAAVWWWWPAAKPAAPAHLQAAVLADGFAAIDRSNHVVELEPDGGRRHEFTLRGVANPWIVGLASGLGVVWRDGKRVAAADVDHDGNVGKPARFGKSVQMMCSGMASNAHRFAVGWTEPDGAVWFVFGPTSASQGLGDLEAHSVYEDAAFGGELARPTFCAVASADRKVALLWNDGSKVSMVLCDKKCPSIPARVGLAKGRELVGFGCVRDGCVIATRGGGSVEATWVSVNGKLQWTKPLRDASPDTRVELAGTGTQVAVAYATAAEPVIVAASRSGELTPIWQDAADDVPSIQWADGRLVIVRHAGGELVSSVVRVP